MGDGGTEEWVGLYVLGSLQVILPTSPPPLPFLSITHYPLSNGVSKS